jgi:hypothetical protein
MAGALDQVSAVAVLGDDPVATAAAAIGLARAQAMQRRVVLVDLLGEGSDLAALIGDPAAPGITDMLEYGVSLRRAAVPIKEQPNLYVVPAGVEPPLQPLFLEHPRWTAIADDFRDAGALVLIVAPALVPGAEALLNRLDGIVIVRGAAVPATRVPTLADVRLSAQYPHSMRRTPAIARIRIEVDEPRRSRMVLFALGALTLAALSWAVWYLRPWSSGLGPSRAPSALASDSVPLPLRPGPTLDSAAAAGWGISLASVNSRPGAMLRVAQAVDSLPSPTYSPTLPTPGGAWWYRVVVGAFQDSAAAESTLVALRARGAIQAGLGSAVPTPLALLVADSVPEAEAGLQVIDLRTRSVPAYALRVVPGWARVYVGTFDSDSAARPLMTTLDSLNLRATLVRRVGSVY